MNPIIVLAIEAALVFMIALLLPAVYRLIVGPTPSDRLQATDILTTLLIGIIVLLGLVQGSSLVIDVGIALAALSFVATLAVARYICEGRVF
jgi:multisubunit Na+/H+ antiporter MnhF subunit